MNKITYPEPNHSNIFFNCYKDRDNPVIYLKEIQNAPLAQWGGMENAIVDALAWAEKHTGQSSSLYSGRITILPNLKLNARNVYFNSNIFNPQYIVVKRSGASCAGVRFERLSDVQRFRAAALKTLEILR